MEQYTDLRASSASELAERIESMVRSGALEQGERLPAIRGLADTLQLAPNTVASAYRTLAMRGTVISDGRRGTRVARRRNHSPAPSLPEGLVDLASGNPDPSLLPDLAGRLGAVGPVEVLYGDEPVDPRLTEVMLPRIADLVGARSMVVVGGALDGVERALQSHLHPGDAVAVEDPGWAAFTGLLTSMGLRPVPVPVDEYGMVPERLARVVESVRAVVITPRVQNPTGAAIDDARRAALAEVVNHHPELLVVEDDHGGLIAGVPLRSVAAGRPRWAYVQSVSKSLGPDLRLAVMAGDEVTTGRVLVRQSAGTGWVSHILQRLTAAVLSDPDTPDLLDRASRSYRARREELTGALEAHGVHGVGRTGLNVWVPIPDEAAVVGALARAGYAVAPGQGFRVATPPGVRISVGRLEPGMADEVAALVAGSIGGRSGGRFA